MKGKKKFRVGTYTVATTLIVIVIAFFINLGIDTIPAKLTKFDITNDQLYSLSDQGKEVAASLDKDIEIYWLVTKGNEDTGINELLDNYKACSDRISYTIIDPAVNPNFAYKYTNEGYYNNSLVVTRADGTKFKFVNYTQIYGSNYDAEGNGTTVFNGENALTAALIAVSSDSNTKVYYTEGHGEPELPSDLISVFEDEGITVGALNLTTNGFIPEDASSIIIYNPGNDISEFEGGLLYEYLEKGGNLLLLTSLSDVDFPYLDSLSYMYGLKRINGTIVEGNRDYCISNYANYLVPDLLEHEITKPLASNNLYVIVPFAQPLEAVETTEDVLIKPLLRTSNTAYAKVDGNASTTIEKEEGDIETENGFDIAFAVERNTDSGEVSRLVWFGSPYIANSSFNSNASGSNYDMIANCIGWMCEVENSVTVRSKLITQEMLSLTAKQVNNISRTLIFVIPIVILIAGIYVWLKRRKL